MKKVIIAESSNLIKSVISSVLKNDFEIIEVNNGFDAITEIINNKPCCVLCSVNIPLISGFEVTNIVKKSKKLSVPIALYSTNKEDFPKNFSNNNFCDDFFVLNIENAEEVKEKVQSLFEIQYSKENYISEKETKISSLNEIFSFYRNERTLLQITSSICSIFSRVSYSLESAFIVLDALYEFVPFDIAFFSVKIDGKIYDFCRTTIPLSENEINDFIEVSHNNFKSKNPDSYNNFEKCYFNNGEGLIEGISNNAKIKAFDNVFLNGNDFLGNIMIGSTISDYYFKKYSVYFNFFAKNLSLLLDSFVKEIETSQSMKRIRKAFSSFVPEEIIEDLIKNADNKTVTAGEKRNVCILICDIRSFTSISEKNKAENVVSFLNEYFSLMVKIIKKYGGSIDKFMGDSIMALFGAPISYEDNVLRAVNASKEMLSFLPQIDTSLLTLPNEVEKIDIGIGLHYGEVILGSIGCEDKKDYTVIGDSVNLASRLEGLTKIYGMHLVVSDSVTKHLPNSVITHRIDKVKVKGKQIPVCIYSIQSELDINSEDYYRNYDKGIELYEIGAFALAIKYFEKSLDFYPESKVSKLMIERCNQYLENPPENWDGAVALTSK